MKPVTIKKCFKCGEIKELDLFYRHKQMADGHLNKCIECTKKDVSHNYDGNREKYLKYERERANLPHRVEYRKKYSKTVAGKESHKRSTHKSKMQYPFKCIARNSVGNAIRDGKIIKPSCCSECGNKCDIHAHHDDYSKPLDVRWLCVKCHSKWHRNNKAIYPF